MKKPDVARPGIDRLHRLIPFLQPYVRSGLDILEVGPYDRPLFGKEDYPNVRYADILTGDELRDKAERHPNRDPGKVVDTDYLLRDGAITTLVSPDSFDIVFCSHVLEHIPDLVGFLNDVSEILKPGGLLLIAYPDRRYTFDIRRSPTTAADMLDRHHRRLDKPTPEMVEDFFTHFRRVKAGLVWQNLPDAVSEPVYSAASVADYVERSRHEYVDVHCSVFSADEFADVFGALFNQREITLSVIAMRPTERPLNEFFAVLENRRSVSGGSASPA